jgi:hypothetical protein
MLVLFLPGTGRSEMKYEYIPTNNAEQSMLGQHYQVLAAAMENTEQLYRAFKVANGNYPKSPDRNNTRHLELEREYEQSYLRLAAAVDTLYPLLQPVWDAAQALRQLIDSAEQSWYGTAELIQRTNVLAAEQLYERGCQFYFGEFRAIRRPHFFRIKDDWKEPRPERYFVVCGEPGNEVDQFIYKTPAQPYLLHSEAQAEANRSVSDSGWYEPHVYDVRKHAEVKANVECRRNPQPSKAQLAEVRRLTWSVQRQINEKQAGGSSEGMTIIVPSDDEAVIQCLARQLRANGWEVRDHFQHGYAPRELWLKGNGSPLTA